MGPLFYVLGPPFLYFIESFNIFTLCFAAFQSLTSENLPSKMSTAEKRSAEEVPEAVKKAKTAEDEEENLEEEEDDLDEEGEEGEEGEDEEDGEDEGVGLQSMNIST